MVNNSMLNNCYIIRFLMPVWIFQVKNNINLRLLN